MPKIPVGLELVKRGVLTDTEVKKALEYQVLHPGMRLVDIIEKLGITDRKLLLEETGKIFGVEGIDIKPEDITVSITEYYPLDIAKITKAIPFAVNNGRLRVAFSRPHDEASFKKIRLLALRKRTYFRTIFYI